MPTLEFALESATGQRADNQDSVLQFESPFGSVFLLADGMGGYQGGAVASAIATSKCQEVMQGLPPSSAADAALAEAINSANRAIFEVSNNGDKSLRRMGSTIVALLVSETEDGLLAIGAHVGDSRLYFVRDGRLFRLTEDHTMIQQLIKNSTLTEEQARDHPQANVLTRALGHKEDLQPEMTAWMLLKSGDTFLLCSDGLSGYVSDEAIRETLTHREASATLARLLLDLAFLSGSDDNVSVLVVRVVPWFD
jgi:serine/threonine protein phosphatase PrpC